MSNLLELFKRTFHHQGLFIKALVASYSVWTQSPLAAWALGVVTVLAGVGVMFALFPKMGVAIERVLSTQVSPRIVAYLRGSLAAVGAAVATVLGLHGVLLRSPQEAVDFLIAIGYAAESRECFRPKKQDSDWSDWVI